MTSNSQIQRKSYARIPNAIPLPRLTEIQLNSFEWFMGEGLRELFDEISPIVSFNRNLELHFGKFWFGEPKYSEQEMSRARYDLRRSPVGTRPTAQS